MNQDEQGGRKTLSIKGAATPQPFAQQPAAQFAFLAPFAFMADHVAMAERQALPDPRGAAVHARLAVEAMVRWLYDHDSALQAPYDDHLAALTAEPSFLKLAGTMIRTKIDLVRKIGNRAAHPGQFAPSQAVSALRELFHIGLWFATRYSQTPPPAELAFSADLLPRADTGAQTSPDQVRTLEEHAERAREALEAERKARLESFWLRLRHIRLHGCSWRTRWAGSDRAVFRCAAMWFRRCARWPFGAGV